MRSSSDPRPFPGDARSTVYRSGISSARQELQAGTARRHRRGSDAAPRPSGSIGGTGIPVQDEDSDSASASAVVPVPGRPDARSDAVTDGGGAPSPAVDLDLQRAGVRAALAELRQHRGPR